jgi:hypothetical protein
MLVGFGQNSFGLLARIRRLIARRFGRGDGVQQALRFCAICSGTCSARPVRRSVLPGGGQFGD